MACHYPRKLWFWVSCCYIKFMVLKGWIVLLFSTRLGLFDICLFFPEDFCKRKLDNLIWTSQVISPTIMESWFWFPSDYCWSLQSTQIKNKQHPTPYLLSGSASTCIFHKKLLPACWVYAYPYVCVYALLKLSFLFLGALSQLCFCQKTSMFH